MRRSLIGILLGATLVGLALRACADDAVAPSKPIAPSNLAISFERDVQPILVSRCQSCHGRETQKAGLRLDRREAATTELDSGERAIVPGKPDESELLRRVASTDPAERMPPKGEPLSAAQVETLRRWIASGAEWPAHWAYRPLRKPEPPRFDSPDDEAWCRTPIDRFILAKLREHGLLPSAPAEKRVLLRRVFIDLTGLPPEPEEVEAFVAGASGPPLTPGPSPQRGEGRNNVDDAYERMVDRLLASPRYGERWARHWMDVVHFAETHGHDQDRPRDHAWPYRDYLIRSLNDDKPYARFVEEQVAGDILHSDDGWATAATGFLATGSWDESSLRDIREDTIDREIGRYLDRDDIVTSVISTFASTTVHCARCHDHKFDPITQQDYFALQAVFAATDKGNRPVDFDPVVAKRRRELSELKAALAARANASVGRPFRADPIATDERRPGRADLQRAATSDLFSDAKLLAAELQTEVAAWEQEQERELTKGQSATKWETLDPFDFKSAERSTLTKQPDGSLLASGLRPETDTYTIVGRTELPSITAVRLEVLTDDSLPMKGPGRQDNGNLHLNEFVVKEAPGGTAAAAKPVAIESATADFNQEGWTIAHAIDGNPATAWGVFPMVGQPHRAVFRLKEPIRRGDESHATLFIELQQTHGRGHLIGRPKLSVTSAANPSETDTLPAAIVDLLKVAAADRTDQQRIDLTVFYLGQKFDRELASLPKPQLVYCGSNQFLPDNSHKPTPKPRAIHVLKRGDVRQPLEPAVPGTLGCIPDLPNRFAIDNADDEGARRVALAKWLTDPRNGLVWRSIVNRVWHYHFGRGLSDTPNDFGLMGSPPSHPELLDWLAVTLQERGGSLKELHRLVVTSNVYRQSSNAEFGMRSAESGKPTPNFALRAPHLIDADNRLLWHSPRQRLDAESIRDAVLQISGKLDLTVGGPSVRQFNMSPGIHVTPNVDYLNFNVDDVSNHRRSVYRFLFRTLPDPLMDSLDCPDGSQLTPVRSASVTPLQALALLNDKLIVRQSELIAERIAARVAGVERSEPPAGDATIAKQVHEMYRLILAREPTPDEAAAVGAYVTKHGLANGCRVLLNSNEFVFVE